jgi:hypothetical protein
VSEGGISGSHPTVDLSTAHVGPTTDAEFNTIRAGLVPVACWRVDDIRFEFDSSFVTPGIAVELEHLTELVKDHLPSSRSEGKPGCPLSVFGHADPVGNDDYNKQLSGRRATAIYALLTRDTHLWEKLFSQPFGNDKWGRKSLETMLDTVSPTQEGKSSQEQAIQHEHDAGKRKALYEQYMEKLCGPELKFKKEDFLGHGDDAGGKGDFQGCSEFNPVLIFSQEDQNKFDQDKDKTEQNAANAPNRRVMVLIFRKGSRVDPAKWPCPRANEGVAGCRKRFWSDGERRRNRRLPVQARKYDETKDTFGCRFYDRLANRSTCEQIVKLAFLRIRLIDDHDKPYAQMTYRLDVKGGEFEGVVKGKFEGMTDANGVLEHRIPATSTVGTLTLVQLPDEGKGESTDLWIFDIEIVSNLGESSTISGVQARLNNLGFFADEGISGQIDEQTKRALQRFKTLYKVKDNTGKQDSSDTLTEQTAIKLKDIYGS